MITGDGKSLFERMAALTKGDEDEADDVEPLDGAGPLNAIPVSDVSQQYAFLAIARLKPLQQKLVFLDGRYYDVFSVEGHVSEIWFDVTEMKKG